MPATAQNASMAKENVSSNGNSHTANGNSYKANGHSQKASGNSHTPNGRTPNTDIDTQSKGSQSSQVSNGSEQPMVEVDGQTNGISSSKLHQQARDLQDILQDEVEAYLDKRHIIDILHDFSGSHPPLASLLSCLRPLQPRLYSISSSQRENPTRVQITVAIVKYVALGRDRIGVTSTFLKERMQVCCFPLAVPCFVPLLCVAYPNQTVPAVYFWTNPVGLQTCRHGCNKLLLYIASSFCEICYQCCWTGHVLLTLLLHPHAKPLTAHLIPLRCLLMFPASLHCPCFQAVMCICMGLHEQSCSTPRCCLYVCVCAMTRISELLTM